MRKTLDHALILFAFVILLQRLLRLLAQKYATALMIHSDQPVVHCRQTLDCPSLPHPLRNSIDELEFLFHLRNRNLVPIGMTSKAALRADADLIQSLLCRSGWVAAGYYVGCFMNALDQVFLIFQLRQFTGYQSENYCLVCW